jgi:hypothetical protein
MGLEEGSGVIGEIYIGRVLVTASSVCVGLDFLVMVGACLLLMLGWVLANCMCVERSQE